MWLLVAWVYCMTAAADAAVRKNEWLKYNNNYNNSKQSKKANTILWHFFFRFYKNYLLDCFHINCHHHHYNHTNKTTTVCIRRTHHHHCIQPQQQQIRHIPPFCCWFSFLLCSWSTVFRTKVCNEIMLWKVFLIFLVVIIRFNFLSQIYIVHIFPLFLGGP